MQQFCLDVEDLLWTFKKLAGRLTKFVDVQNLSLGLPTKFVGRLLIFVNVQKHVSGRSKNVDKISFGHRKNDLNVENIVDVKKTLLNIKKNLSTSK